MHVGPLDFGAPQLPTQKFFFFFNDFVQNTKASALYYADKNPPYVGGRKWITLATLVCPIFEE